MRHPARLSDVSTRVDFTPVMRRKSICTCGAVFEQMRLTDGFLTLARQPAERDGLTIAAIDYECPGGWVPLGCGACEHVQLGIDARRPAVPAAMTDLDYVAAERAGMAL